MGDLEIVNSASCYYALKKGYIDISKIEEHKNRWQLNNKYVPKEYIEAELKDEDNEHTELSIDCKSNWITLKVNKN
jgi:hypothetical protein